ncbi:CDP-diacylglycerol--serine O-phosphatidyltransferase [Syntrophomonas curvata]
MADLVTKRFANFITLLNIVFGSTSIIYTMSKDYKAAALLILMAALMDGLDGKVARRLQTSSDLGRELDSLCDMVSFGVAPAVLLYSQVLLDPYNHLGLLIALLFIICGAYRLARFNALNLSGYFLGLPITIAGGILALLSLAAGYLHPFAVLMLLPVLSLFMISTVRIPKF